MYVSAIKGVKPIQGPDCAIAVSKDKAEEIAKRLAVTLAVWRVSYWKTSPLADLSKESLSFTLKVLGCYK